MYTSHKSLIRNLYTICAVEFLEPSCLSIAMLRTELGECETTMDHLNGPYKEICALEQSKKTTKPGINCNYKYMYIYIAANG